MNVTMDGDGQTTYDLKLGDNLSIGGKDGADGKNGTNGHIGVNGADGKSGVGIDGADGISIKGKDGKDGVTIKGVDGVDGVNGAEGHIGLNGKDGMTDIWTKPGNPGLNGKDGETMTRIVYKDPQGQEHQAATLDDGLKFGGDFGTASAVKLNKQVNVKGNAKKEADLTDGNIGVVSSQYGDNGQLLIKLNKDLNLTDKGSVKMGNTTISNSGITINNGTKTVSLTDGGLNNGGNKITNVGKGEISDTSTDAVNGSQLKSVQDLAGQHSSVEAGPSGNITVISGTNDAGGKKYTVDLANNVNFGQGDKQISINGDNGTVTIGQGDKQIQLNSKDGSITAGDVTINNDGKGTVNGLTNKSWDGEHITSGQAATEDQLQKVEQNVNTKIDTVAKQHTTVSVNGGNAAGNLVMEKTPETDEKGANYDISLSNDVTIGTQGEKGKDGKLTVVSKDGMKAITADAQNGTLTFKDGNNETSIKAAEASKGVDGTTDIKRVAIDGHTMATTDDGMKFAGDSGGTLQQKLNSTTNIKGGADASKLSDSNIGVVSDGKDTLTVKLAKDIKGLDSIETKTVKAETVNSNTFNAGNTTINNDGLTVKTSDSSRTITVQDGNVNMGKNVVTGVADGKIAPGSTDAVNGSQLAQRDEAINNIGGEVNKLGNRVNRVGAGAAALAALHPQDFDPDDKWDFAVGYGNYRGSNAAALGAFYRPNEDTTFSVGGTIGGGENMVNAGVSFKIGQGNHVSNSRVAMAKEIKSLREDVAQLEGIVNRQSAMINKLTGTNPGTVQSQDSELFPDIPANHWAYEYVNKLKQLGVVKGYPDGNFDGDRMMTRYEFATMLYRAIMAGAASNPELNKDGTLDRLAKEFSPELKYIRIDTIAHDKDGNPTIQRVRVIPGVK
nr:S-layer homology domain-containing protein [uncultured Mitsuokella sp.]